MKREEARKRAEALVGKMTVEEKASQLRYDAPAIKRLGIPAYNWWNEALHGVARAGQATVFPQAIGMAAVFDTVMMHEIAAAVAAEGRAKYNAYVKQQDRDIYKGLTFWAPNVNIFRDPRWGRGHETYGEDPYLTSRLGVAFVKGLQGDGEVMKAAACAKHYAVHSGPEAIRHEFNATASPKDMEETYLPAFEALVKEAKVEAVMGAYNRTNGEPCCGSKTLIEDILRKRWGFEGHFVSDCWAIRDFHENHGITVTAKESAAMALNAGCDLNCGNTYLHILKAYQDGLVTEEAITQAAVRLFSNADSRLALVGNYHGTASQYITILDGIRQYVGEAVRILYSMGSELQKDRSEALALARDRIAEAKTVAAHSDVVILCVGLDETLEGEEGDTGNSYASGDKLNLRLPDSQTALMEALAEVKKPVILCLCAGSDIDLSFASKYFQAVLQLWYPGAQGGRAVARTLFGEVSAFGKLPVTFYESLDNLLEFTDYSMEGRTYRYMEEAAQYPFGFGLNYGKTVVSESKVLQEEPEGVKIKVVLENQGDYDTDEVVQVYIKHTDSEFAARNPQLCAFKRIFLRKKQQCEVELTIPPAAFTVVDKAGKRLHSVLLFCIRKNTFYGLIFFAMK